MQRIVSTLTEGGKEARVDQYLFIFLKYGAVMCDWRFFLIKHTTFCVCRFIQSVIPTVDYDFTIEIDAKGGPASSK